MSDSSDFYPPSGGGGGVDPTADYTWSGDHVFANPTSKITIKDPVDVGAEAGAIVEFVDAADTRLGYVGDGGSTDIMVFRGDSPAGEMRLQQESAMFRVFGTAHETLPDACQVSVAGNDWTFGADASLETAGAVQVNSAHLRIKDQSAEGANAHLWFMTNGDGERGLLYSAPTGAMHLRCTDPTGADSAKTWKFGTDGIILDPFGEPIVPGMDGADGATGPKGDTGATGATGPAGPVNYDRATRVGTTPNMTTSAESKVITYSSAMGAGSPRPAASPTADMNQSARFWTTAHTATGFTMRGEMDNNSAFTYCAGRN